MDIIRKITNSNVLEAIFDLPENMKNRKIVITLTPYKEQGNFKLRNLKGALSQYNNRNLMEMENNAWANSVVDRYENS